MPTKKTKKEVVNWFYGDKEIKTKKDCEPGAL